MRFYETNYPIHHSNRKFNEVDLIKDAMEKSKLASEWLHDDYKKFTKVLKLSKYKFCLTNFSVKLSDKGIINLLK